MINADKHPRVQPSIRKGQKMQRLRSRKVLGRKLWRLFKRKNEVIRLSFSKGHLAAVLSDIPDGQGQKQGDWLEGYCNKIGETLAGGRINTRCQKATAPLF